MNRQTQDLIDAGFKKCPFCGNKPNIFQVPDKRYGKNAVGWVVECKDMGCMFGRSSPDQSYVHLRESWNKRVLV